MVCSIALTFSAVAANDVKGSTTVQTTDTSVVANNSTPGILSLVALFLAIGAIVIGILAFRFAKKSSDELEHRCRKRKEEILDLECKVSRLETDLGNKITNKSTQTQDYLTRYVDQTITQKLNTHQASQVNKSPFSVAENGSAIEEALKFEPKTFFGVYKQSSKGVKADQTTTSKEGASTFEIITESDDMAIYHIVEGLSKTQFASLNDSSLVEVIEGNPQSYISISEVEPGKMKLYDDVWRIEQKVKIKLS